MSLHSVRGQILTVVFLISSYATTAQADSAFVGKVYHPYVLPLEKEIEWRLAFNDQKDHPNDNNMSQRIAFGHSVSERVTVEVYMIGERNRNSNFELTGYEVETRWMITDQGEYSIDWGALFEVEKERGTNAWELSAGLLAEKEFGRTSLTTNFFIIYETDEDEKEAQMRLQYRYRWIPQIQPGIELFTGDDFIGIGPAFMGIQRFNGQKQLKWEAGFIFGLDDETADRSFRLGIEYEF
jgi:hypothetical protein